MDTPEDLDPLPKQCTHGQGDPACDCLQAEGYCPAREDRTHCPHWWDGKPCCSCKYNGGAIG